MTRFALGVLLAAAVAPTADPPTRAEIAKATKPAVALVQADYRHASAVCVSPRGYFLAPAWVVQDVGLSRAVTVRLNAGTKEEVTLSGRAVRIDPDAGLALLKVESKDPLPAVTFGEDGKADVEDEVVTVGHPPPNAVLPDGKTGRFDPQPAVAAKTKITGRTEEDGRLTRLSIDPPAAVLAGGPLLDLCGKVIGVRAESNGVAGKEVIPVGVVRRFLARPHVTLNAPDLDPAKKHDKLTVRAEVFSGPDTSDLQAVELVVRAGGRERTVEMKPAPGGGYEAEVVPFEKADTPPPVRVEVAFADGGAVRAETPDVKLKAGGKEYPLSGVTAVRLGKAGEVRLADGTAVQGEVATPSGFAVTVGGRAVAVDPTAARTLTVLPRTEPPGGYRLTAVVTRGGKEVGRGERLAFLKGSEPWGIDGLRLGRFTRPPEADKPGTFAVFSGTDGEHHIGGRTYQFDAKRVRVSGTPADLDSAVGVELHTWHPKEQTPLAVSVFKPGLAVRVQAAKGQLLGEREYPAAIPWTRMPLMPGLPGLKATVDGKERSLTPGRFAIWELEVADGGKAVTKLALDAVLFLDEQADTPVYLSVRYNSKYK